MSSFESKNSTKLPIEAHKLSTADDVADEIFIRPRLHLTHNRFRSMENAEDYVEDAPLPTRAWAFQERLLPSRTLHFHADHSAEGWLKNFFT
jgi:hypothetical protein